MHKFARIGVNSGLIFLGTANGIMSGPVALFRLRLFISLEKSFAEISVTKIVLSETWDLTKNRMRELLQD